MMTECDDGVVQLMKSTVVNSMLNVLGKMQVILLSRYARAWVRGGGVEGGSRPERRRSCITVVCACVCR